MEVWILVIGSWRETTVAGLVTSFKQKTVRRFALNGRVITSDVGGN